MIFIGALEFVRQLGVSGKEVSDDPLPPVVEEAHNAKLFEDMNFNRYGDEYYEEADRLPLMGYLLIMLFLFLIAIVLYYFW